MRRVLLYNRRSTERVDRLALRNMWQTRAPRDSPRRRIAALPHAFLRGARLTKPSSWVSNGFPGRASLRIRSGGRPLLAFSSIHRMLEIAICDRRATPFGVRILHKKCQAKGTADGSPFCLARPEGFEPPTFWSVAKRSIQLSQGRFSMLEYYRADYLECQARNKVYLRFLCVFSVWAKVFYFLH